MSVHGKIPMTIITTHHLSWNHKHTRSRTRACLNICRILIGYIDFNTDQSVAYVSNWQKIPFSNLCTFAAPRPLRPAEPPELSLYSQTICNMIRSVRSISAHTSTPLSAFTPHQHNVCINCAQAHQAKYKMIFHANATQPTRWGEGYPKCVR